MTLLCTKYYWGDQIKEDAVDVICSMHEVNNKYVILTRKPEETDHLGNLDIWRTIDI